VGHEVVYKEIHMRQRLSEAEERAASAARMQKWREERAARRAHLAREASGEAKGFRYAIRCGEHCWVGPCKGKGPRIHDDSCAHTEPTMYEGDRLSAQARAQIHAERNDRGGAVHHSPEIVPEEYVAKLVARQRTPVRK
jgi:hypothetical protein